MVRREALVEPPMELCRPLNQTKTNFLRCRLIRYILTSDHFLKLRIPGDNELGRFKLGNHNLKDPEDLYGDVILEDIDFVKNIPGFKFLRVNTYTSTTTTVHENERQKIICIEASATDDSSGVITIEAEDDFYRDEVLSVKIEICWWAWTLEYMRRVPPLSLGQIRQLIRKATVAYFDGWGERRATCREIDDEIVGFMKVL
jgi:hypothetical protein